MELDCETEVFNGTAYQELRHTFHCQKVDRGMVSLGLEVMGSAISGTIIGARKFCLVG